MFKSFLSINRKKYYLCINLLLFIPIIWGIKIIISEGIYNSIPRSYNGDFYQAVFGDLTEPDHIFYGPLFSLFFVATKHIPFITVYYFAVATFALYFLGLFFCCKYSNLPSYLTLICIALSLWFFPAIISFSTAAFPEIFEFFCISLAIYYALKKNNKGESICIGLAAFMKFIPWFLIIPIALKKRWSDLAIIGILFIAVCLIAATINNFTFIKTIIDSSFPLGRSMGYLGPASTSGEFSGLPEFLLRLTTFIMHDGSTLIHLNNSYGLLAIITSGIIIGGCILIVIAFTVYLIKCEGDIFSPIVVKEIYLLWICILPILTLRSHPHTFVLLVPAFYLIAGIIYDTYINISKRGFKEYTLFSSIIVVYIFSYIWIGFRPGRYLILWLTPDNSIIEFLWKEEILMGNFLLFFNSLLLIIVVQYLNKKVGKNSST